MEVNFTKPPGFIENFFSKFRKWKLVRYKKKKVREEKTKRDRTYWLKFTIKIDDPINPQSIEREFEMMIPAKAAFFAKMKARMAMLRKIDLDFKEFHLVTDDEFEAHELSKSKYIASKKKRTI